jgi:hypothetical protein
MDRDAIRNLEREAVGPDREGRLFVLTGDSKARWLAHLHPRLRGNVVCQYILLDFHDSFNRRLRNSSEDKYDYAQ